MDVPKNETPEVVSSSIDELFRFLGSYGWHILFILVVINLIWSHLKPKVQKWHEKKEDQAREEHYQQNPERLISMQESLEASRRRLQEQHDRIAREHAEKLKQLEEQKRQEKVSKWMSVQRGSSFKPPETRNESEPEPPLRPLQTDRSKRLRGQDYNPLMGSSSGTCFRPSRRGGGAGG